MLHYDGSSRADNLRICFWSFGHNRPRNKVASLFLLLLVAGEFGSDGIYHIFLYKINAIFKDWYQCNHPIILYIVLFDTTVRFVKR